MKKREEFEHDGYKITLETLQENKELTIRISVERVEECKTKDELLMNYLFYVNSNLKNYYREIEINVSNNTYKKYEEIYRERTNNVQEKFDFDQSTFLPHNHIKKYILEKELIEEVTINMLAYIGEEKKHLKITLGDDGDKKEYVATIENMEVLEKIKELGGIIIDVSTGYKENSKEYRLAYIKISDANAKKLEKTEGIRKVSIVINDIFFKET